MKSGLIITLNLIAAIGAMCEVRADGDGSAKLKPGARHGE